MTDFETILRSLHDARVDFIVVGAYGAIALGCGAVTRDLDICYDRTPENLKRLAKGLEPFQPRLRGAPDNLPFRLDAETLKRGMNFTLATTAGDLDLLGELSGVGQFPNASLGAESMALFGIPTRVASVDVIIASKRAADRPKDLALLVELEALKELKQSQKGDEQRGKRR